jgi:hypothetical protein
VVGGIFPKTLVPTGIVLLTEFWDKAGYCLIFGILPGGGSGFSNSALDTLRNVKRKWATAPEALRLIPGAFSMQKQEAREKATSSFTKQNRKKGPLKDVLADRGSTPA